MAGHRCICHAEGQIEGLGRLGELEFSARLGGHTAAPLSLTARRLLCGGQCFSQGHFQGTWQRYP